jgi:hypothetical protein
MSAAAATDPCPKPADVDQLAKEYLKLKEDFLQAKLAATEIGTNLEAKAETLRLIVGRFGSSHAEKSKLLHGIKHEVMVTYGQSVSIDAAAVENFREALKQAKQSRLLNTIFQKTIRWTLQPQASELIRGSRLTDKMRALAAKCEVIKPKTPSVTVRAKS